MKEDKLRELLELNRRIMSRLDLDTVLVEVNRKAVDLLEVERCTLFEAGLERVYQGVSTVPNVRAVCVAH